MIKKLFSALEGAGAEVYLPAKKQGKCTAPYVVVNLEKTEPSKTGRGIYSFFSVSLFAPTDNFAALDELHSRVCNSLKGSPFVFIGCDAEPTGGETDSYKRVLNFRTLKKLCY